MSALVPEVIDPIYLARKRRFFEGEMPLLALDRLNDRIKNLDEKLFFRLDFTRIGKLLVIKGVIRAKIELHCQSCLQALDIAVNSNVNLVIVQSNEEAALIPEGYEPLLCNQEKIIFSDIIEDEVLLALPIIAKHQYRCFEQIQPEVTIEHRGQSGEDSPFSILANLK